MRPESREFYDERASELEAALATAEEERDALREEVEALKATLTFYKLRRADRAPFMKEKPLRWWTGVRYCRAVKTLAVQARSRREAQALFDQDKGEGVDVSYYAIGRARVLREDKPQ